MASEQQVAANRVNGSKGGVKTEKGKAVSRLNARKHSIFVAALTPGDTKESRAFEAQLIASLRPVGRIEEMLVEKLALTWLRIQRCARAESEYDVWTWSEGGKTFQSYTFERMVKLIDLYDTRLTNQFLKLLHEIERFQALRAARKDAPSPVAGDPSTQTDAKDVAQPFDNPRAESNIEPPPAPAPVVCPEPVEASSQPSVTRAAQVAADREEAAIRRAYALRDEAAAAERAMAQEAAGQEVAAQRAI
jgi:hypothetical protein